MITVEYECGDGTPFPVRFHDEDQRGRTWALDRAHGRDPATPLFEAVNAAAIAGGRRTYEEVGLPFPGSWEPGPDTLGFPYFDETPMGADDLAAVFAGCGKLVEQHGSALGIWHERCLPATKSAIAEIEAAGPDVPFTRIAELQGYGFHHTMIPAYVCGNDLTLLTQALAGVVPDDAAPLVANELAQGFENETLRADQRLWELAQRARRTGGRVLDALDAGDGTAAAMAELRGADDAPTKAFFAELDAYLADYGLRAEGWDIACPTWSEQGDGFWAQLRQLSAPSAPEPARAMASAAERRQALVAELEPSFTDEASLGRFRRRLARIEPYVAVREERALWQVAAVGAVRRAALRRGRALVESGVLERADDVLYLRPDELDAPGPGLAGEVAARRAEHERRCRLAAPDRIGGDVAIREPERASDGSLRGVGASRGVASGRVRVIVDLADADRFEPGDVLVCVMTSPPWTPLFGVASAVVVDTGDLGSHPAIAAREYGVPCVVGCKGATGVLVDGELVTVDGTAGTVQRGG